MATTIQLSQMYSKYRFFFQVCRVILPPSLMKKHIDHFEKKNVAKCLTLQKKIKFAKTSTMLPILLKSGILCKLKMDTIA